MSQWPGVLSDAMNVEVWDGCRWIRNELLLCGEYSGTTAVGACTPRAAKHCIGATVHVDHMELTRVSQHIGWLYT